MDKNAKIYVSGHRGLVGSALMRRLSLPSPASGRGAGGEGPYTNLLTRTHAELDLTSQAAVEAFFAEEKPDYVFLAAAKVGGILANDTYPAEFIRERSETVRDMVGESAIQFGSSKPNGTSRKPMDAKRSNGNEWSARTHFREGLIQTYLEYLA